MARASSPLGPLSKGTNLILEALHLRRDHFPQAHLLMSLNQWSGFQSMNFGRHSDYNILPLAPKTHVVLECKIHSLYFNSSKSFYIKDLKPKSSSECIIKHGWAQDMICPGGDCSLAVNLCFPRTLVGQTQDTHFHCKKQNRKEKHRSQGSSKSIRADLTEC